jgi:dipeptidase D
MPSSLSELKPSHIWKHFEQILRIPHCSGCEKALGDYIISCAKSLSLDWKKDKAGNVVVRKSATPGHDQAPAVILQGHLDMVCEKNSDVKHDFSKDPIEAEIKNGWVHAKGTTLGSDNGIGVATSLAIMEDASLVHGPLEFLFTVDEETGLTGARRIERGFLKGAKLLNLDSEEEGTFTIGCAGGADSEIIFPLKRKKAGQKNAYRLKISGLRGGHSGLDINLGRANAIKLLTRILRQAFSKFPLEVFRMEGGNKHNAIPREAWAEFLLDSSKVKAFHGFLQKAADQIKAEYGSVEKDFTYSLEDMPRSKDNPLTTATQAALINFLYSCPHGVLRMHPEIAGLVETSTNLAIIRFDRAKATIICSSRSSVGPALEATRQMLTSLVELAGAKIKLHEGYPGWTPNLQSHLLKTLKDVHKKVFDKEAHVVAVHAGLECGIIDEKFPGMDMISLGPTIKHPHSPEEGVEIASVENFWKLLTAALQELA